MADTDKNVPKRTFFITSDVQLLLDCVKSHKDVIENKQTNKYCALKAWEKIRLDYNSDRQEE